MAKKREVQEINASSMADISFLLLIFFLVATSMSTNQGLSRKLPEPINKKQNIEDVEVNRRNVMQILINSKDMLMVNGEVMNVDRLKDKAKEFIANPYNSESLPVKKPVEIPLLGTQMITKDHVISLQNDRGTSYQAYLDVQNNLVAAYNELREELSREKFQKTYLDLDSLEQKAVQTYYPQRISEAEPKNYGQN
ncbi:MAG: biopolymer transporter ExbD [Paludibacteraceae bacterium]|nr:biopolymer transporter ExbD [Paludibacteraceae bacterium]MBO7636602.1 biopolymer transporter ExbD [Paludibacteraceae bacterium]MBR5972851.1 biopolymer transporter ExbD [Paludibacteraceae bacterium]